MQLHKSPIFSWSWDISRVPPDNTEDALLNVPFPRHYLCVAALRHGQVAAQSDGIFSTDFPPALEERHIPQEEQGSHVLIQPKSISSLLLYPLSGHIMALAW